MQEEFLGPSRERPVLGCNLTMNVKPRVMRNRHGEHEAVVVPVEVKPDEWPERCEESEADSDCGNTFKHSGGDPGKPFA